MGSHMKEFKADQPALDAAAPVENGDGLPLPPSGKKRVAPMSKQLSSKISSCSTKLTEIMAWDAKIKDCTTLYLS